MSGGREKRVEGGRGIFAFILLRYRNIQCLRLARIATLPARFWPAELGLSQTVFGLFAHKKNGFR